MRQLVQIARDRCLSSASNAAKWIKEGRPFWVWLAVTATILGVSYYSRGDLETRIRWAGIAFEFLGITTVVYGLNKRRVSFGRKPIFSAFLTWLGEARYAIVRRPPRAISIQAGVGSVSVARNAAALSV